MADVSDPKIDEAYQDVRADKSETNWLLLDYEVGAISPWYLEFVITTGMQNDRSDKLKLTSTGTGGLAELREALSDDKASFAYARVAYSNDKESTREKFILVVWIGPQCKVMRKAKACPSFASAFLRVLIRVLLLLLAIPSCLISVHTSDVKTALRVYSIEVAAREKDDLNEDPIVVRLRKVRFITSSTTYCP
ncbi:Actin depolymerizing protein [Mycena sanguinolenta]|uniref:Actin depolymerizing protein n=1 Tax=Mycena sanguinolenta TaxID=230812 RepID=A0A8H6XMM7_9AGAR|nr:Actin depolymerizing protein [Mycena sanguinolenta]